MPLQPHRTTIALADVRDHVYRIGRLSSSSLALSAGAMPVQQVDESNPLKLTLETPSPEMENRVLAVSHANTLDTLLSASVAGFVVVQRVDLNAQIMVVLAPAPGDLSGNYFLSGSVRWAEGIAEGIVEALR